MKERRAAHVRPLPPSGDRYTPRQIRATGPRPSVLRRYGPSRDGNRFAVPLGLGGIIIAVALGAVLIVVGGNLLIAVTGQLARAFDDAMSHISSSAPATPAPSGVAVDTPVLDAPPNGGYTNVATVALSGSVPADAVGQSDYFVRIYSVDSQGHRNKVDQLPVGATSRFTSQAVTLQEGPNQFGATLVTPSDEGQLSPIVTYTLDTKPPALSIASPPDGYSTAASSVVVSGKTDPGVTVTVRNRQATGSNPSSKVVGSNGTFSLTANLVAGNNTILVTATDQAGNVANDSLTVKRSYGSLAAHLAVSPATFKGAATTTIKLTARANSVNGGPMAGASAVFTVSVPGIAAIVSPVLTTDQTGTATWKVTISGASAGVGAATVLVTTSDGSQVTATAKITTT